MSIASTGQEKSMNTWSTDTNWVSAAFIHCVSILFFFIFFAFRESHYCCSSQLFVLWLRLRQMLCFPSGIYMDMHVHSCVYMCERKLFEKACKDISTVFNLVHMYALLNLDAIHDHLMLLEDQSPVSSKRRSCLFFLKIKNWRAGGTITFFLWFFILIFFSLFFCLFEL